MPPKRYQKIRIECSPFAEKLICCKNPDIYRKIREIVINAESLLTFGPLLDVQVNCKDTLGSLDNDGHGGDA